MMTQKIKNEIFDEQDRTPEACASSCVICNKQSECHPKEVILPCAVVTSLGVELDNDAYFAAQPHLCTAPNCERYRMGGKVKNGIEYVSCYFQI